jgi:hypothetical protein
VLRATIVLTALALVAGATPASGASGAETFRTPSGNVFCAYEHYDFAPTRLRCDIRSGIKPLPPKPASCTLDWGQGYSLRQIGFAHVLCAGDTIYDPKAKVLAYGRTWHGGGFTCISRKAGLRCLNPRGHGFFLSKEHSYTYTEPKPIYGAFRTPSRNIVCGWSIAPSGEGSIECGIKTGLKPPPKPITCQAGDPNDKRVSLRETGRAAPVLCAGDPGPFLSEAKARVLGYGSSQRIGAITCTSETTGLTCRNRAGHGFFLSRERWRTF